MTCLNPLRRRAFYSFHHAPDLSWGEVGPLNTHGRCCSGDVAIVDDDPAILDSLKLLLEVTGHTVATFASPADFLQNCTSQPSCLILDHHMPQMSGLELAAWLRTTGTALPVLLITSSPPLAISARAAQLGIEQVLEKPPNEHDLLSFVDRHL